MEVIGKGIYSGEYQGVKYQKIVLICSVNVPKKFGENFEGIYTEQVVAPFNQDTQKINVGDSIRVFYNRFGKVDTIFKV